MRFIKTLLTVATLGLVTMAYGAGGEHTLILAIRAPHERDRMIVHFHGSPSIQPDGSIAWSAAQAAEIIEAMTEQNHASLMPYVLSQLEQQGSRRGRCLRLEMPEGQIVSLTDTSIRFSNDGHLMLTQGQIRQIRAEAGDDNLASAFELRLGERDVVAQFADGPTPMPRNVNDRRDNADDIALRILKPTCGKCLSGKNCKHRGHDACCADASDDICTVCKVCKSTGFIDMDLE